jgi:hypothetical protein
VPARVKPSLMSLIKRELHNQAGSRRARFAKPEKIKWRPKRGSNWELTTSSALNERGPVLGERGLYGLALIVVSYQCAEGGLSRLTETKRGFEPSAPKRRGRSYCSCSLLVQVAASPIRLDRACAWGFL